MSRDGASYRPWQAAGNSSKRSAREPKIRTEGGFPGSLLKTLVLGIGNLLMGDEGVGVRAVERLRATDLAEKADLVDGGTGGLNLLSYFGEYPRIILVDAASDGHAAGTVSLIRPRYAADFPATLTAHDIGLKDLIEAAALVGNRPEIELITISIDKAQPMTLELSKPVRAALEEVERLIRELLHR